MPLETKRLAQHAAAGAGKGITDIEPVTLLYACEWFNMTVEPDGPTPGAYRARKERHEGSTIDPAAIPALTCVHCEDGRGCDWQLVLFVTTGRYLSRMLAGQKVHSYIWCNPYRIHLDELPHSCIYDAQAGACHWSLGSLL